MASIRFSPIPLNGEQQFYRGGTTQLTDTFSLMPFARRSQEEYIRHVLEAYRKTPGTMGTVRRADRMLAAQLYINAACR